MSRGKVELRDEAGIIVRLMQETGLPEPDVVLYLRLLRDGSIPASDSKKASRLVNLGMAILSGDGKRVIPVHPRLGIANSYRTWREAMVREINERRMRVDKLIIELIPLSEAATEKRASGGGG